MTTTMPTRSRPVARPARPPRSRRKPTPVDGKDAKVAGRIVRACSARFVRFIREVVAELRKVIWPTRKELLTYTTVVVVFVAIMMTIVARPRLGLRLARPGTCSAATGEPNVAIEQGRESACPSTTRSTVPSADATGDAETAARPAVAPRRCRAVRPMRRPWPAIRGGRRPATTRTMRPGRRAARGAALRARRLVRRALLRRLREQGQDQPRDPDHQPRHGGVHLPGRGADPRRGRGQERQAAAGAEQGLPRVHPGPDGADARSRTPACATPRA